MYSFIGKKTTQTQAFLTDGTRIPVTVIEVPDSPVIAVKTLEKDGYMAVQLGMGLRKKPTKSLIGHVKKANLTTVPHVLREMRITDNSTLPAVGDTVKVEEVLKPGDIVKVTGISKGKGFAGVVKRHNFRGGPRTHGQSDRERAPGSIGQTTTPGRVYKGKKMAGRMGNEIVSVLNLQVIDIATIDGKKTILIKGLVPGPRHTVITIEKTGEVKEKNFVPLLKTEEPEVSMDEPVIEKPVEDQTGVEVSETQAEVTVKGEQEVSEPAPKEAPADEEKKVEEK